LHHIRDKERKKKKREIINKDREKEIRVMSHCGVFIEKYVINDD
jgi:hypothetical protein